MIVVRCQKPSWNMSVNCIVHRDSCKIMTGLNSTEIKLLNNRLTMLNAEKNRILSLKKQKRIGLDQVQLKINTIRKWLNA
jgi:hypothetical protein